jgi:hypothetical protein
MHNGIRGLLHRHPDDGARPEVRSVVVSGRDGAIEFDGGRCTIEATDTTLHLVVYAETDARLSQITAGIARRLEGISRRDRLNVSWNSEGVEGRPAST